MTRQQSWLKAQQGQIFHHLYKAAHDVEKGQHQTNMPPKLSERALSLTISKTETLNLISFRKKLPLMWPH